VQVVESSGREKMEVVKGKEKNHEREGWKVLGFDIAWFWLFASST
jgi:hypothetical protein